MKLLFDPASAQAWADFSGDFNPIHFDADLAGRAGLGGKVVHGMLALLHVKQAVAKALEPVGPTPAWQQFKAMFRSPLLQGHAVDIVMRSRQDTLSFRLADDSTSYFTGTHAQVGMPESRDREVSPNFRIDAASLQRKAAGFFNAFPSFTDPWIFMDAVAFSEILRVGASDSATTHPGAENAGTHSDADAPVVMQISHRVAFDPARIAGMFSHGGPVSPMCYSIRRMDSAYQEGARVSLVELTAVDEQSVFMQVEVGLISKEVIH